MMHPRPRPSAHRSSPGGPPGSEAAEAEAEAEAPKKKKAKKAAAEEEEEAAEPEPEVRRAPVRPPATCGAVPSAGRVLKDAHSA